MELSLSTITQLCGGKLSASSNPNLILNSVVIDSRQVTDKTLFIAIKGQNVDGHSFVNEVCNNGNNGAIVEHDLNIPNVIYVKNTIEALKKLAHNYRLRFQIPIVAITGSNGKTTVKNMLASICNEQFGMQHVVATQGNMNNNIGVPLTVLNLEPSTKIAIIEMGMNHSGELTYLSHMVQPTIAVINNVMLAHAGFFNSLEDIAHAKGEIYSGLAPHGVAYINKQSAFASLWIKEFRHVMQKFFGTPDTTCYLKSSGENGLMQVATEYGDIELNLPLIGEHNKANAVTAIALALECKCSVKNIIAGLVSYTGYSGRLELKHGIHNTLIIDDSYNANPDSVKAAILAIKDLPRPHWFILGDLAELGKFSDTAHAEIATFAMQHHIDFLLTLGTHTAITHEIFNGPKMHFTNHSSIVKYCQNNLPDKASILVKGSASMNLSQVVRRLTR